MNLRTTLAILVMFLLASTAAAEEKRCIGRIIIVGNTYTPDWFIHELHEFHGGYPIRYPELRLLERDLANCGRFLVDPQKGIRPTVRPLRENDPGPVVDIVITVEEPPWNACWPAGFDSAANRAVGYAHHCRIMGIAVAECARDALAQTWRQRSE